MIIKNNDQEDQKSFPNQKVILEIMILTGFQCDLCFFSQQCSTQQRTSPEPNSTTEMAETNGVDIFN